MGRSRDNRIQHNVSQDPARVQEHNTPAPPDAQVALGAMCANDIWDAVRRISHSRALSGCNRLTQLLDFVVSSTLRGEASHLKETTIGVAVFARSPDYDPKVDTIVRSQAWRLRAKLRKYYASEGANDPIVIELPIGHYVPAFHTREEVETNGKQLQ
jgi:hypothetical protein